MFIDKEDYEKVKQYNWAILNSNSKYKYVIATGKQYYLLNRYILGIEDNSVKVMFKNRNTLDFRKSNLEIKNYSPYFDKFKIEKDNLIIYSNKDSRKIIVDIKYYKILKKHKWYINRNGKIITYGKINNMKKSDRIPIEYFIIDNKLDEHVYHINGNKLDNRLCNLSYTRCNNKIIIKDELTILIDKNGNNIIIDTEDLERTKSIYWWRDLEGKNSEGYARGWYNGKFILMHRFIMGVLEDEEVVIDHINHNTLDNRKTNLRITDNITNCRNRYKNKNNTSGITGVNWHKATETWQVRIGDNYKRVEIGYFEDFNEAVKARKKAEEEYDYIINNDINKDGDKN